MDCRSPGGCDVSTWAHGVGKNGCAVALATTEFENAVTGLDTPMSGKGSVGEEAGGSR